MFVALSMVVIKRRKLVKLGGICCERKNKLKGNNEKKTCMENCQCCVDCCMGCGYFFVFRTAGYGVFGNPRACEQMAQKIEYPVRKAAHMSEYAVLALLIFQALTAFDRKKNRGCMALGITAAYAATDEFHQLFVPGRAGRVSDVLIDSSGVLLGIAIVSLFMHIKQFLKTKSVYA